MDEDKIINFCVASAKEMQSLGKLFGASFLVPVIFREEPALCVPIISLYGSPGSGKTEFSKGIIDQFNDAGLNLCLFEEKWYGDYLFRHADLGHCFYWENECAGLFEKVFFGRRLLTSTGGKVPRTKIKAKGFDLFEHASLSHLSLPGVGVTIIIGHQNILNEVPAYLTKMEQAFRQAVAYEGLSKVLRWLGWKKKENKIASSVLPQIHAAKELIAGMNEGKQHRRHDRIVSVNLYAQNAVAQRAFSVFGTKAARFSYP
jgi:hypothetical protein